MLGGSPVRLFRLSPGGAATVRHLGEGMSLEETRRLTGVDPGSLARRLLDAAVFEPRPPPGAGGFTAADVTVVIPVRDRATALPPLLARIPGALVVDDGSVDHSGDVAAAAGAKVIRRPVAGGPAAARNTGIGAASTPLVAFVDSDCLPDTGWLERLLPHFADPAVGAVAPRITGRPAAGPVGLAGRYDTACSALDMGPIPAAVGAPGSRVPYVPAAAVVARRHALVELGGFSDDMPLGEDVDLVWRLVGAGWTVRYAPDVAVAHAPRRDWEAVLGRRFAYGLAAG
ncbi:MAG: glycosyltransferase, partial [Acidimicrobiia bacterium]